MSLEQGLTLFTSDSRPKYANDALSVLALPAGATYQFRYETRYLPSQVGHAFETSSIRGTRLLIAFRAEQQVKESVHFIVPLRWGTLSAVKRVADFYLVQFELNGHPLFCKGMSQPSREGIELASGEYMRACTDALWGLPVHEGLTSLVDSRAAAEENCWLSVALALAFHNTFSDTHFLRIADLTDFKGAKLKLTEAGHYLVKEKKYAYASVDYFAGNYGNHDARLQISTDTEIIRIASGERVPLDSRYDSVRIWLQALAVPGDTLTEVQVETHDNRDGSPQTRIRLPLEVKRSRYGLVAEILVSAFGAAFVAMPGLLGDGFTLATRISFVAGGAVLLAFGTLLKRG